MPFLAFPLSRTALFWVLLPAEVPEAEAALELLLVLELRDEEGAVVVDVVVPVVLVVVLVAVLLVVLEVVISESVVLGREAPAMLHASTKPVKFRSQSINIANRGKNRVPTINVELFGVEQISRWS